MDFSGVTSVGFRVLIFLTGVGMSVFNLSVRLLSLDEVSGVCRVERWGGLLLGEEVVPWAAHFASNFDLLFEPGGRPTNKI